jgi:hypothetical protein
MSLIYCPECGHEISAAAVACPNCGRPIQAKPVVERKVVSNVVREERSFPKWAIIPIVAIGGMLILFIFLMLGRNDQSANDNLSVNVRTRPGSVDTARATTDTTTTTVPPATDSQTLTVPSAPSSSSVSVPSSSQNVPGTQTAIAGSPAGDKATVIINAKVAPRTGSPRAVRNERFYLLDKDVETILMDANVEPVEGQTLTNSLGLAIVYPDRYGDFNRKALRAIKDHIKYAGTTDGAGKAQLGGIQPDSYYLFGITKVGNGFAMWSSPVSINSGENLLNLSPASVTEMQDASSGEE